jgi:hypothetical protein
MNVSPDVLRRDTVQLIREIDAQIDAIKEVADSAGMPMEKMRDRDGNWIMPTVLLAKATAYSTLVALQDK